MKPKSLLVLTLLVVGLGAFVWFGRELPSSDERTEQAKLVLAIDSEAVRGLEILWDDNAVELSRRDSEPADEAEAADAPGNWMLSRPVEARADGAAIDGLVRRLVSIEKERTLEDVERADVGLAPPRGRVRLSTEDGEQVLEIGSEVPASSTMTLAIEGEAPVYVVAASIWAELTKDADDWRDKQLFTGQRSGIERINIEHQGERLVLAKRGEEFWVESPLADRADQTHANSLLSTIAGLRAERFVEPGSGDPSLLGLSPADTTIEVVMEGRETPMRIEIGAAEEGEESAESAADASEGAGVGSTSIYMAVDGQIVTTTAMLTEHSVRPVSEWRSKDLVSGEVYELARVEIEDDAGTTELRRVESDWLRDGETIDYGVATDLLYEISGGAAQRAVDPQSVGELGEPTLTFKLVPEGAAGEDGDAEILRIYPSLGDETPARVSTRDVVLMLSAETAAGLRDKLAALRQAPVQVDDDAAEEDAGTADVEPGAPNAA